MVEELSLSSTVRLNDRRTEMPVYGLGLSHQQGGFSREAVLASLAAGVPLLDTARRYGNEEQVAEAVGAAGVDRSGLFLTTKLWPGDATSAETVKAACLASMGRLSTVAPGAPIDLYLQHWPDSMGHWMGPGGDGATSKEARQEMWRAMELCVEAGFTRAVGVSNFMERHLCDVLETASIVPAVNQVEFNPYQHPRSLKQYCEKSGIVLEGYSPLSKGRVLVDPALSELAARVALRSGVKCSPALVLLRWSLQSGVVTIPKSRNPAHIRSNLMCFDFELSLDEMAELDKYHIDLRCTWDPSDVP